MDTVELELLAGEVDALTAALELSRWRHVAGFDAAPAIVAPFEARSPAAHRDTVAALRQLGQPGLADRVAALRAERAAAGEEEAWRAAEAGAQVQGPDGLVPLAEAMLRLPGEPDRARRLALGRAVGAACSVADARREAAAEVRARARAELGLLPDWERVVEADALLSASDDAWRELLGWLARDQGLSPGPKGDLERADLLRLLALEPWSGLFPPGMLALTLRDTLAPLGLELGRIRVDDADRPARWPGAHALGTRVSLRRRGGVADWMDLFEAAGRALAAALGPPAHRRDPALGPALGGLLSGLLLDAGWLGRRLGVEKREVVDLSRLLALRRLFGLRTRAAGLRVASEVERGTSGQAWRAAHREALTLATLAAWPDGLAARDDDAPALLAALRGAAWAEQLRAALVERFDEDWWRNPRSAEALAGLLAGGGVEVEPGLALSGAALSRRMG